MPPMERIFRDVDQILRDADEFSVNTIRHNLRMFRGICRRPILFITTFCILTNLIFIRLNCEDADNFSTCILDLRFFDSSRSKGQGCRDEESCFFLDSDLKRNYEDMMRKFRVFVYPEGDPRTFFHTPKNLIRLYASEAYFFRNMEQTQLRTQNPDEADMYFIPISIQKMSEKRLSLKDMRKVVEKYIRLISWKYPYWNKTSGADHFFVSCHQLALQVTQGVPDLVNKAIRVVCFPEYGNGYGYIDDKDLALPHVLQPFAQPAAGNDTKKRTRLFLLGGEDIFEGIDLWNHPETQFFDLNNYSTSMLRKRTTEKRSTAQWTAYYHTSKFCLCPGGSQMSYARIADAIHYGCVPVVWPDLYELPFSSLLNWSTFSVQMEEGDHLSYHVWSFLENIPKSEYRNLQLNTVKVQKYFQWNSPPIKYDVFHLIMYQLWMG